MIERSFDEGGRFFAQAVRWVPFGRGKGTAMAAIKTECHAGVSSPDGMLARRNDDL